LFHASIYKNFKLQLEFISPESEFQMKKIYSIFLVFICSMLMVGCGEKNSTASNNTTNVVPQASPKVVEPKVVTIPEKGFIGAVFMGKDSNGKTKEEYFLELQDAKVVKVLDGYVYGKDTSSGSGWYLLIGDNAPRIYCLQETPEAKKVIVDLKKKVFATITGNFDYIANDALNLKNCSLSDMRD
jgi:hypothetical protein